MGFSDYSAANSAACLSAGVTTVLEKPLLPAVVANITTGMPFSMRPAFKVVYSYSYFSAGWGWVFACLSFVCITTSHLCRSSTPQGHGCGKRVSCAHREMYKQWWCWHADALPGGGQYLAEQQGNREGSLLGAAALNWLKDSQLIFTDLMVGVRF